MHQFFLENFARPEDKGWAKEVPERCPEGGTTHLGAPRPPGAPWWVVLPSEHPQVLSWTTGCLLAQKSPQEVSLRLDSIWY